eukprot:16446446-Heterocapsa_arctica.AAC.1
MELIRPQCHCRQTRMRAALQCLVPAQVVDVILLPSDGRVHDVDRSVELRVDMASHLLGAILPVVAAVRLETDRTAVAC